MEYKQILARLESLSDPKAAEGMARYGITPERSYGVSIPNLRKLAKEVGTNHALAERLWSANIRETRILASMVDDPQMVSERQVEAWAKGFDYWEVCDQACMNLFDKLPFAYEKVFALAEREREFEKRAAFALMACLAWHDKKAPDARFEPFLPLIKRHSTDERNYVKKAVNWALRQIGKRGPNLNKKAIETAKEIQKLDSRSARWIASDALRELTSEAVTYKLRLKHRS